VGIRLMKAAGTVFLGIVILLCGMIVVVGSYEIHHGLGLIVSGVLVFWVCAAGLMVMYD